MKTLSSEGTLEQFKGRNTGPVIQFIKYGISGGLATLTHIEKIIVVDHPSHFQIIKDCTHVFIQSSHFLSHF